MFENAWGTTCSVCANLLSTKLYQLPLCGGMSGNFPISKVFDMLSLTESSWAVWRWDRSVTIGSLIDGDLSNFSCCRRRGSHPSAEPSLQSQSAAGSGMDENSLTFWTSSLKGRLGGATCSPSSVGSSGFEAKEKEEAEAAVPYSFCSKAWRGDASLGAEAAVSKEDDCVEGGGSGHFHLRDHHLDRLLSNSRGALNLWFIYLFAVLRRFQHCTGHITMGSWKGRGNQYIQFVRVLYCKLLTNGKQLPAFPL